MKFLFTTHHKRFQWIGICSLLGIIILLLVSDAMASGSSNMCLLDNPVGTIDSSTDVSFGVDAFDDALKKAVEIWRKFMQMMISVFCAILKAVGFRCG